MFKSNQSGRDRYLVTVLVFIYTKETKTQERYFYNFLKPLNDHLLPRDSNLFFLFFSLKTLIFKTIAVLSLSLRKKKKVSQFLKKTKD